MSKLSSTILFSIADDTRRVGFLSFPPLAQIVLLRENLDSLIAGSKNSTTSNSMRNAAAAAELEIPNINSRTKIFELSTICDLAKVTRFLMK